MTRRPEEVPLEISTDPSRLDVDRIHEFLSDSYWAAGRSRAAVEKIDQPFAVLRRLYR